MTKKQKTLALLQSGWTTALDSALHGGCLALSQRCGEFRRAGLNVIDKWVKTKGGATIKAYRIVKAKG